MARFQKLTALICTSLLVSGCAVRFTDDFDADTIGQPPNQSPPGPPAGDFVTQLSGDGSVLVSSGIFGLNGNALRLEGPVGNNGPAVFFGTEPVNNQSQPIYASWRGRTNGFTTVYAHFQAGEDSLVRVDFNQSGNVAINSVTVGTFTPGGEHQVIMALFPDSDTYRVTISGQVDVEGTQTGSLENAGEFPAVHLGLAVSIVDGSNLSAYQMDDVLISQRNPG